jgi:hypothetical protein
MEALLVTAFAVTGALFATSWVGFAVVRWRHLAFRSVLVSLQRISRLQDPRITQALLFDSPVALNLMDQAEVPAPVFFSAGVATADYMLFRLREQFTRQTFQGYCYRLLFGVVRSDLLAARRLSSELREFSESAVPERLIGREGALQMMYSRQHEYRLRVFATIVWRFTRLAANITGVTADDESVRDHLRRNAT